MKAARLFFVLLVVGVALLIPFLQYTSQTSFQTASTLDTLRQIKESVRSAEVKPTPESLYKELISEVTITAHTHEKGTILPERAMQLTLNKLSPRVCRHLVQELAKQTTQDLWQRLDVNGSIIQSEPDADARERLCAGHNELAVYFRY